MSNSVRSHRLQPTRLCHPWDSPGKNTGVGCRFFLQCMKVKSESEVAQSYLTIRCGEWEQVLQMASQADGAARRWWRWGEGHCLLKSWARPVGATVRTLEVRRTQPPSCPLDHQNTHWSEARWTGAPWGEDRDRLLPHCSPYDPCSTDFGWTSPLMVTHWQLLPWRRSPLQIAEQDLLPGDRVQSNSSQVWLCWGLHLAMLCYEYPWRVSIHPCPLEVPPDRN